MQSKKENLTNSLQDLTLKDLEKQYVKNEKMLNDFRFKYETLKVENKELKSRLNKLTRTIDKLFELANPTE